MKIMHPLFTLLLLSGVATAQEQHLFNGKDLTGWDGAPGWWYVEDGVLTSESTAEKPCQKATYLVWAGGEPSDFELSLDFRLSPHSPKANSGVQIRSERRPDWDTFGYQADMTATGHLVGFVYHHSRGLIAARGDKVHIAEDGGKEIQQIGDSEALKAVFKSGEWNHYRIVCMGPEITLYVNDVLMCQIIDRDAKLARSKGIIALQMHPGPPMKVQFRNIVLKTLGTAGQAATGEEAGQIQILQSDAGIKEKADACRELARIGTPSAVPALAALLGHPELSHMARYGLEPIPGAAADGALRAALGTLQGEQLAGLVCTIGLRGDAKAVNALVGLLQHTDASVAQAAALALGRIGTEEAARGLQAALAGAPGANLTAVCDGLLDCAETFFADGKPEAAVVLYDALRALPEASRGVRAGAWRGAIRARGKDGLPLLAESIRSEDDVRVRAGIQTALQLDEPGTVPLLAELMAEPDADRQVLVAGVLGARRDSRALAVLLVQAKTGDPAVRPAAIQAVAAIGGMETIAPLMDLMKDPDREIAEAAETGLIGLRGSEVDAAVVNMLHPVEPEFTIKLVDLAARRRITSALPALAGLMKDPDDALRLTAIKSYGELAGTEQLPVMLASIKSSTHADDIDALGKAIALVCIKAEDPQVYAASIQAAVDTAVPEAKPMLLKILQRIGKD